MDKWLLFKQWTDITRTRRFLLFQHWSYCYGWLNCGGTAGHSASSLSRACVFLFTCCGCHPIGLTFCFIPFWSQQASFRRLMIVALSMSKKFSDRVCVPKFPAAAQGNSPVASEQLDGWNWRERPKCIQSDNPQSFLYIDHLKISIC